MTTTIHALAANQSTELDHILARIADYLSHDDREFSLIDGQGHQVTLPREVVDAFQQVILALQSRQPTVLYPQRAHLTTQQAADLMGVSRPHLIGLLAEGRIPYSLTGTHRRIAYEDAMAYMKVRDAERSSALKRLTQLREELGLYDHDD